MDLLRIAKRDRGQAQAPRRVPQSP